MNDGRNPLGIDGTEPDSHNNQSGVATAIKRKAKKNNKRAAEGAADSKAG
jgi:hypothetical protein